MYKRVIACSLLLFVLEGVFLTPTEVHQILPLLNADEHRPLIEKLIVPSGWTDTSKLVLSGALFFPSILYNKIHYGNAFSVTTIIDPSTEIAIEKDERGCITSIKDGKNIPIVLGGIARNESHIQFLKKKYNLSMTDKVCFYTLNRSFECCWSGLDALVRSEKYNIIQYLYPTTDYTVPSFIDILRAVRDIENCEGKLALVHCKAGKGRSAGVIVAYLITVCCKAKVHVTIQELEDFVRSKRPQIHVSSEYKQQLYIFEQELLAAGTLQNLCEKYAQAMAVRDELLAI